MAHIAYIRVSTAEQNEGRQLEGMKQYNIDKTFIDKTSGKNTDRPQLQAMLDYAREGDVIHVHDFSRLARNTADLLKLTETLDKKGITLISNKENIDTSTATGRLMLSLIGSIAQFERENMLERQREGIKLAQQAGKYKGRQKAKLDEDLFNDLLGQYQTRKINKVQFAKQLGVSRPTLDKLLAERS